MSETEDVFFHSYGHHLHEVAGRISILTDKERFRLREANDGLSAIGVVSCCLRSDSSPAKATFIAESSLCPRLLAE